MNNRQKQIGFSQRIRLEWLEQTASLVLAGNDKAAINDSLQALLKEKVSIGGKAVRGNREKAITILIKIWLNVPKDLEALRTDGLELLRKLPRKNQIAVHWGMSMAVYPFWAAVASHTGRLLRLQGTAAITHVQRRVREQYGERETVSRAVRRIIRSFVDWDVLRKTSEKGVYTQGLSLSIQDSKLISWLVEASLHSQSRGSATIKDLLDSTRLFPFRLARVSAELMSSSSTRIEILRHGLDEDLVMLRSLD